MGRVDCQNSLSDWENFRKSVNPDFKFIFDSITMGTANLYLFFGDPVSGIFYISDNLRDAFGFTENYVNHFPSAMLKKIHGQKSQSTFIEEIKHTYYNKLDFNDIKYEIEDKNGNLFWVRSYTALQWNKDRTELLSVSGRLVRQDEKFVVDPISNFYSDITFRYRLGQSNYLNRECTVIGFCDNFIQHVNSAYGIPTADEIINRIGQSLIDEFRDELRFYRLPGIRGAAITSRKSREQILTLIGAMQDIAVAEYQKLGDFQNKPFYFAAMDFPQPNFDPKEAEKLMVSLLKMASKSPEVPYVSYNENWLKQIKNQADLSAALTDDVIHSMHNFRIVIQPIVDAKSGCIKAGETLLRWKFNGTDISPAKFIPVLESKNTIREVGNWVFEQAAIACSKLIQLFPDFYLTVNVSIQQLNEKFISFVKQTLEACHLSGK